MVDVSTGSAANLPVVSAVLLSCNCEDQIGAALEGALAQDYGGLLEILVSDDASRDRSFEIVRARAADYRGPHKLVLNRRTTNSGRKSAHLNDVFPRCTGEILVCFDGDDISEPTRVSRIVAYFMAHREVQAVYSNFSLDDGTPGKPRLARVPRPPPGIEAAAWFARIDAYAAGATLAVRRDVVDAFGSLDPSFSEDVQLPFRAGLLGQVEFIDEPLVRVLRHVGSFTFNWERYESLAKYRARVFAGLDTAARVRRRRLADIDAIEARQPDHRERWAQLRGLVDRSMRDAELTRALVDDRFVERLSGLIGLLRAGAYRDQLPEHAFLALAPQLYLAYRRRRLGTSAGKQRAP